MLGDWLPLPREAIKAIGDGLCVTCKASKMLCGKPRCPLLVRYNSLMRTAPLWDSHLSGSSPPGFFVGRFGYPKVNIGPLVPPFHGDTALLDHPEEWLRFTIDEIVGFRSRLVRGLHRANVTEAADGGALIQQLQELAIAGPPAEVEVEFSQRPRGSLVFRDDVQPYGPTAPLRRLGVDSIKVHRGLEEAWYDTDLRAKEAILNLYEDRLAVSRISRAMSAGVLGRQKARRFVPTRWSITAVDDTIGTNLVERLKDNPLINEFRVYESWKLDNRFIILLLPRSWMYELVEAWYPGSTWNPLGRRILMFSDSEGYHGRKDYASIGGCYYAARLAIAEALNREGKQAAALVLREAHPGYILPVGVWNVRENVRRAMQQPYLTFPELPAALHYISQRLEISMGEWLAKSDLLRFVRTQRLLEDYGGVGG